MNAARERGRECPRGGAGGALASTHIFAVRVRFAKLSEGN